MLLAVTTCPGRDYLAGTLASLQAAGFAAIDLFDDVDRRGSRWNYARVFERAAQAGAERLLIVQDDVIVSPLLLERVEGPIPTDVGVVSFHDCSMDFPFGTTHTCYVAPARSLEGAQCLLFPRESVEHLHETFNRVRSTSPGGPHNVDLLIGNLLSDSQRPQKLVYRCELVEHVGRLSACHPGRLNFPRAGQTIHDLPCVGAAQETAQCPDSDPKSGELAPGVAGTTTSS